VQVSMVENEFGSPPEGTINGRMTND